MACCGSLTRRLTLNPALEGCSQGLLGPEGSCALHLVLIQLLLADGVVLPGREGQCLAPPSPEHESVARALLVGRIVPADVCSQGCAPHGGSVWWLSNARPVHPCRGRMIHSQAAHFVCMLP